MRRSRSGRRPSGNYAPTYLLAGIFFEALKDIQRRSTADSQTTQEAPRHPTMLRLRHLTNRLAVIGIVTALDEKEESALVLAAPLLPAYSRLVFRIELGPRSRSSPTTRLSE